MIYIYIYYSYRFLESDSLNLSAESVALSLLRKFSEKQLPKASDLQWLVSEQEAPQRVRKIISNTDINCLKMKILNRNKIFHLRNFVLMCNPFSLFKFCYCFFIYLF